MSGRSLARLVALAVSLVGSSAALAAPPAPPARRPLSPTPERRNPPLQTEALSATPYSPYTPPPCTGIFPDVPCPGGFAVNWIEQLYNDGITAGCGGGDYCPGTAVTRAQMAVFLEKAMRGAASWPTHVSFAWAVKNPDGTPNPTGSGTALLAAVASIPSTGNDAPSYSNPWLLKVGPGMFDLGSGALTVPSYVSVEGAGRSATTIQSTGGSSPGAATVIVAAGEELRDVAINNTGGAAYATGLIVSGGSTAVRRVDVTVTPGTTTSRGIYLTSGAGPTFEDVAVSLYNPGSGDFYGVFSDPGSSPTFDRVSVSLGASGTGGGAAIQVTGGLTGRNVRVSAGFGGNGSATIGGVVVNGPLNLRNSDVNAGCAGSAGPAYAAYGVSTVTLTNVNVDVWLYGNASCTAYGVYLNDADARISGSSLIAYNYALFTTNATSAHTVNVDASTLEGYNRYVSNGSGYTTVIGATRITDLYGNDNTGSLACAGVYGQSGAFYASTCP